MPTGPKGENARVTAINSLNYIVDIATGQIEDRESTPEAGHRHLTGHCNNLARLS